MKKGNSIPYLLFKDAETCGLHLLMGWMFQRLLYKYTAVKIDKYLLASPFRPLTSHHIPIIVCSFLGVSWDLLGSFLGFIWKI